MKTSRRSFLAGLTALPLAAMPLAARAQSRDPLFASADFRGGLDASQHGVLPDALGADAKAFNRLLREAESRNMPVFLPPGIYRLSDIDLPASVRISGVPNATRLVYSGEGRFMRAVGSKQVALTDIVLDGANRWLAGDQPGLMTFQDVEDLTLDGCHILGAQKFAIWAERCGGRIDRNEITGAGASAIYAVECRDFAIRDNVIRDCGDGGILVHRWQKGHDGTMVTGNRISRILAKSGGTGEFGNGINIFRADGVQIANNHISDCAFTAIRSNAGSNVQISANQCLRSGETAIYSEFGFEGAMIANNLIDGAANGILSVNFNEGGRLAVISGNLIRNLKLTAPYEQDDAWFGIGIEAESDATVIGNVIEGAPRWGMLIGWGPYLRDVNVTGNVIRGAAVGIAATVVDGAGRAAIRQNIFSGIAESAIAGYRWSEKVTDDLSTPGAQAFAHLDIADNNVS
ncbi:MAG: TIGR03808 family TAT-translocated repetitive protein [Rhizobium sp.]|nr:TIGR03808 family TAT-translocated repetitive protein [Rhizobium sp.]